jgi:hypothetical protein
MNEFAVRESFFDLAGKYNPNAVLKIWAEKIRKGGR